ncbi:hypothetical protein GH741_10720 [Aquibacillus halophilus]|uniref:Uncharacterized protein n=1 Tax=Aquibacillus halophilus TaxID=930132 RepID=A0A6A8DPG1_9BACI|nr:SA1362 family protein [Aquibacillus halophilus]MRH43152.1 hypothetical protein [Aquibacillus halophilus]
MFRHKLSPFIYLLIGLAVLGFGTQLFNNTASLLINLLLMVAIGAVIFGIIYYFVLRKRTSNDIKKYKRAVKQSKMKYKKEQPGKQTVTQAVKKNSALINKRKDSKNRPSHLRVIDGNKQKRKNRASF